MGIPWRHCVWGSAWVLLIVLALLGVPAAWWAGQLPNSPEGPFPVHGPRPPHTHPLEPTWRGNATNSFPPQRAAVELPVELLYATNSCFKNFFPLITRVTDLHCIKLGKVQKMAKKTNTSRPTKACKTDPSESSCPFPCLVPG